MPSTPSTSEYMSKNFWSRFKVVLRKVGHLPGGARPAAHYIPTRRIDRRGRTAVHCAKPALQCPRAGAKVIAPFDRCRKKEPMADFDDMLEDLKQKRDELRVQMNLASREVKEEWDELEEKMEEFSSKAKQFANDAKLRETGSGLGDALGSLGHELKLGYQRIRDALK